MRVLVTTPASPFTGYGNDGIGLVQALLRRGIDVSFQPMEVQPPLPKEIAALLTRRLEAPFDLTIQHAPPGQLEFSEAANRATGLSVAWSMWEYTSLDNMDAKERETLARRIAPFDAFLSYDAVSQEAFTPYLADKTKALKLQGGFAPEAIPVMPRDWFSDTFRFCMVGQLHDRKDPFTSVNAFRYLKENYPKDFEGAELHLKTSVPGLFPQMEQWVPKLKIHYATWPVELLHDFYAGCHVLLAPSRGEGKNLPALEFQTSGGAVIATNWGGHVEWLNESYAYPLDCDVLPVEPSLPNCKSARASQEHLAEIMLHVYRNRAEVKQKAELASRTIPGMCSWDSVVTRLFDLLEREFPTAGGSLKYQLSRLTEAGNARV